MWLWRNFDIIFDQLTWKKLEKYFTSFNNVFHGIIAGPLLIFVYLFLQLDSGKMLPPLKGSNYFTLSMMAFAVDFIYIGWVFYKFRKDRRSLIGKYDLKQRLEAYRSVSYQFYFLMTLSGVLAIFAIYLTGEMSFSFIYLLQLFLLSIFRPSVHNICKYLDLKDEERDFVLKKKEFLNDKKDGLKG